MKPREVTTAYRELAPRLPETAPLIVFDGVCVLCSAFVQWVMSRDARRVFWFTPAQGPVGQLLYRGLRMDPKDFETNLLVVDGIAYGKLEAFVRIATRLGGVWRLAGLFRLLPARMRDPLYDLVARNRYRLFGQRETCWLPSPTTADRVV